MTTSSLVQIRCGSLRSKSSYGVFYFLQEAAYEIMGASTTFWCLKTMGKAGPDEHFVHRSVCVKGRSCWHSSEDPA